MAAGMVNIGKTLSAAQTVSSCRYIMREEEALYSNSNITDEKEALFKKVEEYAWIEKIGNRELGIRGRHDAQCMTKLILMLPNTYTLEQNKEKLDTFLQVSGIGTYPYVVAIHRGEDGKEGIINRHAHLHFFQRKFEAGNSNKNRIFSKKDFIDTVRRQYQEAFGLEANETVRLRVGRPQYEQQQKHGALKQRLRDLTADSGTFTTAGGAKQGDTNSPAGAWTAITEEFTNSVGRAERIENRAETDLGADQPTAKQNHSIPQQPQPRKPKSDTLEERRRDEKRNKGLRH